MKIAFNLISILILTYSYTFSQEIKGRILDTKSNNAVICANIYIEGKTLVTVSNQDEYFSASSFKWSGSISPKRAADLLPFEYQLTQEQQKIWRYIK